MPTGKSGTSEIYIRCRCHINEGRARGSETFFSGRRLLVHYVSNLRKTLRFFSVRNSVFKDLPITNMSTAAAGVRHNMMYYKEKDNEVCIEES